MVLSDLSDHTQNPRHTLCLRNLYEFLFPERRVEPDQWSAMANGMINLEFESRLGHFQDPAVIPAERIDMQP